jgi:RNA polymerase sigma-70 factor (ECF subfamily)
VYRDSDYSLIAACQEPDSERFEAAFEALYLRYCDRVYSVAYRITGSSADAMDVTQESFAVLFRKLGSFRFDSRFSTWLFRIVVNCSIDYMRHEKSRGLGRSGQISPLSPTWEPVADEGQGPRECAEHRELGDHVHACIQKLSPKLRAILVLRYLEGQSYEDLSATLGVSMGTVKSRLARAHIAMERVLGGSLGAFGMPDEEIRDGLPAAGSEGAA